MSWLFDRLSELAVADRIEIIVGADHPSLNDDGALTMSEVLERAASSPKLRVSILSPDEGMASVERLIAPNAGVDEQGSSAMRCVIASDRADFGPLFGRVSRTGLGIAIGGVHPDASIKVDALPAATSIIDALITLRNVAHRSMTAP